jgi:uncharacterized membrane protein
MFVHLLAHAGEGSGWHLPPLHPILVNFTAALIPASLFSDLLGRWLKRDSLHKAAWWMLLYAAVITPFTAAAGWWWMRDMEGMNDWRMPVHKWLGLSMAVVTIALAVWRWDLYRANRTPSLLYVLITALALSALIVQGELGGQMTFGSMEPEASHTSTRTRGGSHDSGTGTPASNPSTQPDAQPHEHQHS